MNKAEEACIGIYEAFTQIESQRLGVETKIAWNVGMNLKENRADFVDINIQEELDDANVLIKEKDNHIKKLEEEVKLCNHYIKGIEQSIQNKKEEENDKLIAENKRLKFENKEQQDYFQTLPILECTSLSNEEIWLKAWCAVVKSDSCTSKDASISWADGCLDEFKKRFKNG